MFAAGFLYDADTVNDSGENVFRKDTPVGSPAEDLSNRECPASTDLTREYCYFMERDHLQSRMHITRQRLDRTKRARRYTLKEDEPTTAAGGEASDSD